MEHNEEFWKALDSLLQMSEIVIDRPKGTAHPKFTDFIYEVNYGYIKDTTSMDGGGIDVWKGTDSDQKIDAVICTIDLTKRDSEIKLLIGCTEEEKEKIYAIHNNSQFMKGILIRR
jgi:inorganic pyrophosphatase